MKLKDFIEKIIKPSTTSLSLLSIFFIIVFSLGGEKDFNFDLNKFINLINIFYKSELFAFIGIFAIIMLLSRGVRLLDISIKSTEWFENKNRITKGWPTKEEEVVLESLFYSGISFDELYKFIHFALDASFIAFTENSQATVQNYSLLARNDSEKYWLSYFRFSHREAGRIRMLYLIISNFMEVLTGDLSYKKELKDQSEHDPELKNIDTEKLLIAIISKDEVKKIFKLCDKYYKMIIDKRIEGKNSYNEN